MFKIYSKGSEYALRALTQIPFQHLEEPFLARDLCAKAGVPESSTRKVFQKLVKEGLLTAIPGPGGGYKLSKDPKEVSLLSIVQLVDGDDIFDKCIMGFSSCDSYQPCPIHHTWQQVKTQMIKQMAGKSLEELIKTVNRS